MKDEESYNPSWDLESNYSPDGFYVRATDDKGHKETVNVGVKPNVHAQVSAIVASKRFPQYRTNADFYRDAGIHRLHQLNDLMKDPSLDMVLHHEILAAKVEAISRERKELTHMVQTINEEFSYAHEHQDRSAIRQLMEEVMSYIEEIRDPYREEIEKTVKLYRQRLKDMPIARIH